MSDMTLRELRDATGAQDLRLRAHNQDFRWHLEVLFSDGDRWKSVKFIGLTLPSVMEQLADWARDIQGGSHG